MFRLAFLAAATAAAVADAAPAAVSQDAAEVEQWGVFEIAQSGPADSPAFNAFASVKFNATFVTAGRAPVLVPGFYDGVDEAGSGVFRARFSPPSQGIYNFSTAGLAAPQSGSFLVSAPSINNHGPVAADPAHPNAFIYADGTPHFSVGTTSYAWVHVSDGNAAQTLATLSGGPFNKMRMTLFPKRYSWTHIEPPTDFFVFPRKQPEPAPCHQCCPSSVGEFDFTRFEPTFWRKVEGYVEQMRDMGPGVIADIILWHPYDSNQVSSRESVVTCCCNDCVVMPTLRRAHAQELPTQSLRSGPPCPSPCRAAVANSTPFPIPFSPSLSLLLTFLFYLLASGGSTAWEWMWTSPTSTTRRPASQRTATFGGPSQTSGAR